MGVKQYELNEAQWARIAPLLPGKIGDPGRSGADNRLFVDGVLWVLRSGAFWQHLPERYGKWKTVHARFTRWAKAGVWEKVFDDLIKDRDNQYLMLDSTLVRAHQQATTGRGSGQKRGPRSGGVNRPVKRPGFSGGSFNCVMRPYRGSRWPHSSWPRPAG